MAITTAVERSKGKGRGPAQILLIEDSPSDAMLFGEALKEALPEANLHWVTAAEDGLRRLRPEGTRGLPDLIVCDLNLQGSTALEFLAEVKQNPATARIPLVVYSGSSDPEDAARCYAQGADFYLIKPLSIWMMADQLIALTRILQQNGRELQPR